jgi:hypothetical protein
LRPLFPGASLVNEINLFEALDIYSRMSALIDATKMPVTRERFLKVAISDGLYRYDPLLRNDEPDYNIDWDDTRQVLNQYDCFDPTLLPLPDTQKSLNNVYTHALQVCSNVTCYRHIFQSSSGRIGLACKMEKGDLITILHGSTTPVILRPYSDGTYLFITTCYFEDEMYGEAVTWEEEQADEFVLV